MEIDNKVPDIRHLNDMKSVLFDQEWLKTAVDSELYYMYRGLKEKDNLRYDITIIPPKTLGQEYIKTKGHYHIGNYGEIYIVLEGDGIFLMQKEKDNKIIDVYYVHGTKGDYIPVPSQYGHVTINNSSEKLKMANWVSKDCMSDYSGIKEMKGACYYYTKTGWIKNNNYGEVPEIYSKEPLKEMPDLKFLNLK